ncbi:hypothetical protein HYW18_00245 [Candidatus Uhrbacteria bacterium]|nr:hypothetical protein [Candidatus Uhrbacteria bacterium]
MKHLFSFMVLGLFLFARPVFATVVGSFVGLEEDVQFDAIWVYENDDITLILDPINAGASLYTIFVGDADAAGCTVHLTHVSSGIASPAEYIALGTVIELSSIQIGIFEINTNTTVPRCHVGYNFTTLGPVDGAPAAPNEPEEAPPVSEPESEDEPEEVSQEITTCADTDGGSERYVAGAITHSGNATFAGVPNPAADFCLNANILREYYCTPNEVNGSHVSTITCANGCAAGRCLTDADVALAEPDPEEDLGPFVSCTDSDGGVSPHQAGSVSAEYDRALPQTYVDICSGDTLTEYACNAHAGEVQTVSYTCPGGCNDGKCLTNMCQDDDGGDKKFIFGRMTHDLATLPSPVFDTCTSNNKIMEYTCNANFNDGNPENDNARPRTCALGCLTVTSDAGTVSRCKKLADLSIAVSVQSAFSWLVNLFN